MKKQIKKENFYFQYHIKCGNHPRIWFYSVSPFEFVNKTDARKAATDKLIKRGINPNKAKIYVNQRGFYYKHGLYNGGVTK